MVATTLLVIAYFAVLMLSLNPYLAVAGVAVASVALLLWVGGPVEPT